jgi:hypothetical protein
MGPGLVLVLTVGDIMMRHRNGWTCLGFFDMSRFVWRFASLVSPVSIPVVIPGSFTVSIPLQISISTQVPARVPFLAPVLLVVPISIPIFIPGSFRISVPHPIPISLSARIPVLAPVLRIVPVSVPGSNPISVSAQMPMSMTFPVSIPGSISVLILVANPAPAPQIVSFLTGLVLVLSRPMVSIISASTLVWVLVSVSVPRRRIPLIVPVSIPGSIFDLIPVAVLVPVPLEAAHQPPKEGWHGG